MSSMRFDYIHSVDIGIVRFNRSSKRLEILLTKRDSNSDTFPDQWALPGVIVNSLPETPKESIKAALERLLMSSKVGRSPKYIEQVHTTDENNDTRDPRCWSSSTYYIGVVDDTFEEKENQEFTDLLDIVTGKKLLPFDHNLLCSRIFERLQSKTLYTNIHFFLIPDEFAIKDVLNVATAILGYPVQQTSIRVRCTTLLKANVIHDTGRTIKDKSTTGPASTVYQLADKTSLYFFDRAMEQPKKPQE
ncbi:hypothetical protein ACI2KR_08545 [Pseudomonas luteola]